MAITEERLEHIRANAELVARELAHERGADVGFNSDGVAYVEQFIERQRTGFPETAQQLVGVLGCYLGEAIIEAVPNADWAEDQGGALIVLFANGDSAYPFYKVEKQIAEGRDAGESILSFYNVCLHFVAAGKIGQAASKETP
jgi:hypothetical protein